MADTWTKGMLRLLLLLNLLMYTTGFGLAACSFYKIIDPDKHVYFTDNMALNHLIILFSLISGTMGVYSMVVGMIHLRAWCGNSLASDISFDVGCNSWAMTFSTFVLVCMQMTIGNRGALMSSLESFIIILTVVHLLYLITLHLGINSSKNGPGYCCHCNAYEAPEDSAAVARPELFREACKMNFSMNKVVGTE